MDTLKLIIALYKKELADANELKLLFQAQLEQEQQRVQQLEAQSEEQLEAQLRERVEQLEAQLRERDEQIKELRQQISKVVEE